MCFDSELEVAHPCIQWSCDTNWKPSQTVSWSLCHYVRVEHWTRHPWGFPRQMVLSWSLVLSEAVVTEGVSEDACGGGQ